jgi:hypothetical protein
MKAKIIAAVIALTILSISLAAYQHSFFNLVSPSELGMMDGELSIQHRLRGAVDDDTFDNFFGMDNGANVALSYRQAFLYGLEAKAGYIRDNSEYFLDASWRFTKEEYPVHAQIGMEFFSYEDSADPDKRNSSVLVLLAAQNKPLYDRFYANVNLGYNADAEAMGLGIGAGIRLFSSLTVLGEYYPDLKEDKATDDLQNSLRKKDSYSFGVKFDTYGHEFMFMLGNNEDMNLRQILHGSLNSDLKFGFNVKRRFGL